jgi:hypothetical protein
MRFLATTLAPDRTEMGTSSISADPADWRRKHRGANILDVPIFVCARAASLLLLALVLAPSAARADDDEKTYEIKLVRPLKVGQKYELVAEGALTRETTVTLDGKEAAKTDDGFGVRLDG